MVVGEVRGIDYNGEEVLFTGARACDCRLEQEMTCGHWLVYHDKECLLYEEYKVEPVRGCYGPWVGSCAGLNNAKMLTYWRRIFLNNYLESLENY